MKLYSVGFLSLIQAVLFIAFLSTISVFTAPAGPDDADALYANRTDLASARRAAELWSMAVKQDAKNFDAAWKLARADYWLGTHASESERRMFLEAGVEAGRTAVATQPNRSEGHFWMAANMGALAESFGRRAGLKYRKPIKEELETVLRLDAPFLQGSADRALGRWYFKVPGWLGGDKKLAEEHLRRSLRAAKRKRARSFGGSCRRRPIRNGSRRIRTSSRKRRRFSSRWIRLPRVLRERGP
jgi:hypothetical protein